MKLAISDGKNMTKRFRLNLKYVLQSYKVFLIYYKEKETISYICIMNGTPILAPFLLNV